MKRGFEENVPRVRPRVKLGRALDEQLSEAQNVAAEESGPPIAPVVHTIPPLEAEKPEPQPEPGLGLEPGLGQGPGREHGPGPEHRAARLAEARSLIEAAAPPPRRRPSAAAEVADLVRELTSELSRAAEINARLKSDLDAALVALRAAADESREQKSEAQRLSTEVEKRATAARDLLAEVELLEAERDGALAQAARLSRELREEKARAAAAADDTKRARAEAAQARDTTQRLTADLNDRVQERDEARAELLSTAPSPKPAPASPDSADPAVASHRSFDRYLLCLLGSPCY